MTAAVIAWLCWCALLVCLPSKGWDRRGMILGDEG